LSPAGEKRLEDRRRKEERTRGKRRGEERRKEKRRIEEEWLYDMRPVVLRMSAITDSNVTVFIAPIISIE
jgi:hypothetical protein